MSGTVVGIVVVAAVVLFTMLGAVLGIGRDTRQAGRKWYAAGPDPEPWRTD